MRLVKTRNISKYTKEVRYAPNGQELGRLETLACGTWVFYPTSKDGAYSQHVLDSISKELLALNTTPE